MLSLVIGTADHNDSICGYPHIEANMQLDVIDGHGYWQHPQIGEETKITNTPMVNDPWDSTIVQFARTPVQGLPYTISETNHPYPHEFACEGIPSLTAYAMLNGWDGIYWFCYNRGAIHKDRGFPVRSWFDMSVDPIKVTQIASCAPMWHRHDVEMARQTIVRCYTHDEIVGQLRADRAKMRPFFTKGFSKTTPLVHATRFTLNASSSSQFPQEADGNAIVSDTGQLAWYDAAKKQGTIVVDTSMSQALIGFVSKSTRHTANLSTRISNEFCAVQLSSLDRRPIHASGRLILSTTARSTNSGIRWRDDRQTLESWGDGPALVEPVKGEVELLQLSGSDFKMRVTMLTVTGRELGDSKLVDVRNGRCRFPIGDRACTWYLLERLR